MAKIVEIGEVLDEQRALSDDRYIVPHRLVPHLQRELEEKAYNILSRWHNKKARLL